MRRTFRKRWYNYRLHGEGEGNGEGGTKEGGDLNKEKTFTQKDVDDIINKRFGKEKSEKEKLIAELNGLRQSSTLTAGEKEKLAARVDELETSIMSEQEKAAKERTKLERDFTTKLNATTQERDTWQRRYVESSLERALTDAAVESGAESPVQIRMMYRGNSRLEEKDGTFTPMLKFQGLGSDGKSLEEFDLPVSEALKKIREDGLNKNLFKSGAVGGTGKTSAGTGGKNSDPTKMPLPSEYQNDGDYASAYQAWRDNYNLDGTARRKSS